MVLFVEKYQERQLQVFGFSPTRGRSFGNHAALRIPHEPLKPGPIGRYIAVIDYDKSCQRSYDPVDLDAPALLREGGLDPSELNLQFHQQMVYAVASLMVHRFEQALGRPVHWPWVAQAKNDSLDAKLRIFPHYFKEANAYYDARDGRLLFGYFRAPDKEAGSNLPGQIVYTCLEFDVVAHETAHPLLDSVRPLYKEARTLDTPAFNEAFCDLLAIFEHFHFEEAVLETIWRTGGLLHQRRLGPDVRAGGGKVEISAEIGTPNPLIEIARQFGEALGLGNALRDVLNTPPGAQRLDEIEEPHARGAVLIAAIFDAFFTVYNRRTRSLYRIGRCKPGDELPPELATRVAAEAAKTARHFSQVCIRALDYCPPDELSFGDYLRALITADHDLVPNDIWGYRSALIDAFRSRGIRPLGVSSYSEEALRWPEGGFGKVEGVDFAANAGEENQSAIEKFVKAKLQPGRGARLRTHFRRSQRVGPQGQLLREMVVQIQPRAKARKGTVLIIDEQGAVRYHVTTSVNPEQETPADPLEMPPIRDDLPSERPLRIFAFDPSQGCGCANRLTVRIPFEELEPGPVGEKIAVIDYDASNGVYYKSVDLNDPTILLNGGLEPSELNPYFHQQMVYAVVSETIRRFEFALGRPVKWRWSRENRKDPLRNRLRVFPHAMQAANAYYDRDLGALMFGYFRASEIDAGASLPGQIVYTCLSHDIVAHEATHAVLDSVQTFYLESTGPDSVAFHEAFGDIVALLQHFSFRDALLETIRRTGGRIHTTERDPTIRSISGSPTITAELSTANPLVELARQFGHAMGTRVALRGALGTPPGEKRLDAVHEVHDRGAILVAAIFDAFFTAYTNRIADLMRIARAGGAIASSGDLHPDLAELLAREASKTARHFENMCLRALDYCPPVDIEFGDFLRAIITSDALLVPVDRFNYRQALIEAFASRGIWPRDVRSMSEECLLWETAPVELVCKGLVPDALNRDAQRQNAVLLSQFGKANATALGLSKEAPVQAYRFHSHASQRVDPHGIVHREYVAQLMQKRKVLVIREDSDSPVSVFRGGTTLILDEDGKVRYLIGKCLENDERCERQLEFIQQSAASAAGAALTGRWNASLNLAALHRGY
jgi:hypothetical protein